MFTHQTDLLRGIPEGMTEQILGLGFPRTFQEGETVFSLGSEAKELYLVEQGRVRLTLPMELEEGGEEVLLEERVTGQLLGWSALVPPFRFTLNGSAAEETQLLAIPGPELLKVLSHHPEAGHVVMSNLSGVIGQRLQMFQTMWVREIQRLVRMSAMEAQGEPNEPLP